MPAPTGWTKFPVTTVPVGGPSTGPQTYNWVAFELYQEAYNAIQEKLKPFDCCGEFPPPSPCWQNSANDPVCPGSGTLASISISGDDLTLNFTGVDWHLPTGFSGSRWKSYESSDPDLCYIPSDYDIVFFGDQWDVYTHVRCTVTASTYNAGAGTGTITVKAYPLWNAQAANFIGANLTTFLTTCYWRMYKTTTGVTATERRLVKPNIEELWRGTASGGWIDSTGVNGMIKTSVDDVNPNPYYLTTNPAVSWSPDQWAGRDLLASDSNGRVRRVPVKHNIAEKATFGIQDYNLSLGTPSAGTFTLTTVFSSGTATTTPLAFNASNSVVQTALALLVPSVTVTGSNPYAISFPAATPTVDLTVDGSGLTGGAPVFSKPSGYLDFGGAMILTATNVKGMPGRAWDMPIQWYTGAKEGYYSLDPNDLLNTLAKPVGTVGWQEPTNDLDCREESHLAFDIDAQIEIQNVCECARAGDFISIGFYKAWRELQLIVLGLATSYVDSFNTYGDGTSIRMFTPATLFQGAGINSWASSVSYAAGVTTIGTHTAPFYPFPVYWTVLDTHSGIKKSGTGALNANGTLGNSGIDAGDDGLSIVLSFGFSARSRRRFKYLYPRSTWIADCDELDGCIDPPTITPAGHIVKPTGLALAQSGTSGGTLNYNTTFYYKITAYNGSGETDATSEVSVKTGLSRPCLVGETPPCFTTTNTYSVTLHWNPVLGAAGYRIYGRSASGTEHYIGQTSSLSYIDDGTLVPDAGRPAPSTNTTTNSCMGTGTWVHRDVSANYIARDTFGFVREGTIPFVENEYARFMGDNYQDTQDGRGGAFTTSTLDAPYWARLVRHTRKLTNEQAYKRATSGSVTTGGNYWLRDTGKTWWNDGTINTGTLRIQGGTATGGSTTTLVDSSYATGNKACWFSSSRNVGSLNGITATPYSFFTVELYAGGLPVGWTVTADGTATWGGVGTPPLPDQVVPIQSFAAGTFTLANTLATGAGAGYGYLIYEPKWETNRWAGRTVTITKNDGTKVRLTCRYSSGDCLFFDTQAFTFDSGFKYTIDEVDYGSVMQYKTAAPTDPLVRYVKIGTNKYWVQPTGTDSRGAANFLPDMRANAETKVDSFGACMGGDDVHPKMFNEFYTLVKALYLTKAGWTRYCPPGETNNKNTDITAEPGSGGYGDQSTMLGYINSPPGSGNQTSGISPYLVFVGSTEGIGACNQNPSGIAQIDAYVDNTHTGLLLNDAGASSEIISSVFRCHGQATKNTCIAAKIHFLSWAVSPSPLDPSGCTGPGQTYADDGAGLTSCITDPFCSTSLGDCCPSTAVTGKERLVDKFDSGGLPVAWHKYTEWEVTGPDTAATVQTSGTLGSFTLFNPGSVTIGICDHVSVSVGWVNTKYDAIVEWTGMVFK